MTDAKLIERLRDVGAKGWTVRGQVCAGDLMIEAADRLEAIANKLQRMKEALEVTTDLLEAIMPRDGYDTSYRCRNAVREARAALKD